MRAALTGLVRAAWALAATASAGHATPAAWEALRGIPILDVRIHAGEVFDPSRPGEDHLFCRWANALHVRTRTHVVQRELLLAAGDAFVPELAAESERNLRALDIFQSVAIEPLVEPEGLVLDVRTVDRWTAELRTELSRQGGISQVGVGLSDANLIGRAFELGGSVTSSSDVDAASLRWRDPRIFGTRWSGSVALRRDDLQDTSQLTFDRPFYSDTVRWTGALAYFGADGTRRRFENGNESERLDVTEHVGDAFVAHHRTNPRLSRWALIVSRQHQRGDDDRDAGVVALAWSALERQFDVVRDIDLMGAVEDVATGLTVQIGAGADLRLLGGARNRAYVRSDLGWAQRLGPAAMAGCQLRQYGFLGAGAELENARTAFEAFGFWQTPGVQTLAWRAGIAALHREPADLRFNLGGDDRLRGYEARHLSGERILYAGVEERLFTDWRLFFLRMGAVVFVDAAAAWDQTERLSHRQARLGAGVGLRIASNRAGSSLAGLDLAFGTNSVQLSLASGQWFRVARSLNYLDPRPFR
jgi:hypothetical protein